MAMKKPKIMKRKGKYTKKAKEYINWKRQQTRLKNKANKVVQKTKRIQTITRGVKKSDKVGKIDGIFKKKIVSKAVIPNILEKETSQVNLEYRKLFKNIIKDKQIMDIMLNQDNIQKIKHRFEIRAEAIDVTNKKLLEMKRGSGGDLMSLNRMVRNGLPKGTFVRYGVDLGEGYDFRFLNEGVVEKIKVTIIFRP